MAIFLGIVTALVRWMLKDYIYIARNLIVYNLIGGVAKSIKNFRVIDAKPQYFIARNLIGENIKHNYSFRVEVIEAIVITLYAI